LADFSAVGAHIGGGGIDAHNKFLPRS